eukprot:CAMPEP_0206474054 /NCGR_PEP_ID=MMETSP0324_2-20121206/33246_1 /ASSEMBLY_ACC=CAM_ASM_000836 /TAXON_ID=2866 /ORGANISM="Crypthecodinium cohnii, Strain Seligo" /LENGTH=174 /DNA_ID=CAMNT_0053949129 /DNA_START=52 /DNA_END=576 /DNA_ORIENTATION=-
MIFIISLLALPLTNAIWIQILRGVAQVKALIAQDGLGVFLTKCCIAVVLVFAMWYSNKEQEKAAGQVASLHANKKEGPQLPPKGAKKKEEEGKESSKVEEEGKEKVQEKEESKEKGAKEDEQQEQTEKEKEQEAEQTEPVDPEPKKGEDGGAEEDLNEEGTDAAPVSEAQKKDQ